MVEGYRKDRNCKRSHRNESVELMRRSLRDIRHPGSTKKPVGEEGLLQLTAA